MLPSPCDKTCILDTDVNGKDRCVSCLRLPCELNWNTLPKEKQEEIWNRDKNNYFSKKEDQVSEIDYPKEDMK